MKAVILATENGAGLGQKEIPKALVKVLGLTLLERNLCTLKRAGINDFVIVTGYKAGLIKSLIKKKNLGSKFNLKLVKNENYKKGSVYSVLAAKNHVDERFLILPTNIVFDPSIIKGLKGREGGLVVCTDSKPRYVDTDIFTEGKKGAGIKRRTKKLGATDIGIFLCSKNMFSRVEKCIENGITEWDGCINKFRKETKADVYDVKGSFWYKISTREELKKVNWLLPESLRPCGAKPREKYKYLQEKYMWQKPAIVMGRSLASRGVTGNQVTLLGFISLLLVAFFFSLGEHVYFIVGWIFLYLYHLFDWTDGLVARLKFMESKYGEWLDWAAPFVGWVLMFFGMTFGVHRQDPRLLIWVIGFLTIFGLLMTQCISSQSKVIFGSGRKGALRVQATGGKTKGWGAIGKIARGYQRFSALALLFIILIGGIFNQMFYVLLYFCITYNLWVPYLCAQLVLLRPHSKR